MTKKIYSTQKAITRSQKISKRIHKKIRTLSIYRSICFSSMILIPVLLFKIYTQIPFFIGGIGAGLLFLVFIVFIFLTAKLKKNRTSAQNHIKYYEKIASFGLVDRADQVNSKFNEKADTSHPYANDLNINQQSGLLDMIDHCNSGQGWQKLKSILLNQPDEQALDISKWKLRSAAIRELSKKRVMKMRWIRTSAIINQELFASKTDWGLELNHLRTKLGKNVYMASIALGSVLSAITIISYPLSQLEMLKAWYLLSLPALIIVFSFISWHASSVSKVASRLSEELSHIHKHFRRLKYIKLQESYWSNYQIFTDKPYKAIASLTRMSGLFSIRKNPLAFGIMGIFFLHEAILLLRLQNWLDKHQKGFELWLDEMATLDAFVSLASLRQQNPYTSFPEIEESKQFPYIHTQNCRHPLIPEAVSIGNHATIEPSIWILTGSNMSGKSTFLRTLGCNYLLALCGAPVFADFFRFYPGGLITSMQHTDNLGNSYSLFYSEVKKLAQIQNFMETTNGLVLIDEMLRGTNARERQIAQKGFLKQIQKYKSMIIVATHDLELIDQNNDNLFSKHFQESMENGKMTFDYKLYDGPVQSSNALEILKKEGIRI